MFNISLCMPLAQAALRMCGAQTLPGLAIPSNVKINNVVPAVVGDIDSHNMLGSLINVLQHRVMIGGIPAIPSIISMAAPDILGLIPHVQGLPIPISGSQNVMIGQGNAMAAIGMMQRLGLGNFGALNVGELVSIGQQVMGQVMSFTQIGGGAAVAQIGSIPSGAPALGPGATVTGQTSGYSFTFANYIDSRVTTYEISLPDVSTVPNALVQDDGQYIVIDDYFNLYPTQNLTLSVITT
jgi:hypothetical protein